MDLEDNQEVDPLDDSFGDKSYEPNKETVEDEDQDDIEQKCEFVVTKQFGMIRLNNIENGSIHHYWSKPRKARKERHLMKRDLNLAKDVILVEKHKGKGGTWKDM